MENFNQEAYIPKFRYSEAERAEMRKNGLSDEEIDQKEAMANDKLVRKALGMEDKDQAA